MTKANDLGSLVSGTDSLIDNNKLQNSSISINGSAVSLGGSVTITTVVYPTITGISPAVISNNATNITISGANYQSIPYVDFINGSTGAITSATSVSFNNSTSLTAGATLSVDGTYFIRVENNDGTAVRSGSALLTVSDDPVWTTSAGSIYSGDSVVPTITLSATDATSFAVTTGSVPTGLTFTSGTGSCTIAGTQTQFTTDSTSTFSITATDAQGQTAVRQFTMTFSFAISNSGQFN